MDNFDDQKVKFEDYRLSTPLSEEKGMLIGWIINHSGGLVKNGKQAMYLLLGFVVTGIIISLFLSFKTARPPSPPPADQIIPIAGPEGKR